MEHYEIILYWSAEDDAYIAEVPELLGCMAHGSSHENALSNVKDAMLLWLDVAQERGLPVPAPKGGRLMYA
ncbi:MAG: type II toxin-antitoxin system HicB family antitoxin [Gallionellaceae bacterium]|nr:type II toxin-antitoxin system HicB family antitoxin [Gallionellaceae bacterium]